MVVSFAIANSEDQYVLLMFFMSFFFSLTNFLRRLPTNVFEIFRHNTTSAATEALLCRFLKVPLKINGIRKTPASHHCLRSASESKKYRRLKQTFADIARGDVNVTVGLLKFNIMNGWMYTVSKKSIRIIWHNFTNSQRLLIIFWYRETLFNSQLML